MEAIETYLNNVFAAFPQTEAILAMKREMLADLEEKYQALKREGKSENEAVGSIITNFGNIDEIAAELGSAQNTANPSAAPAETAPTTPAPAAPAAAAAAAAAPAPAPDRRIPLSYTEALAYIDNRRKAGRNIALGVGLILLGVAGLVLLDGTILQNGSLNTAGLIVFFIALIAAVPIFIVSGLRMNNNADYKANGVRLDASCADQVAQQYARFMQRFTILVALGVVLILVGVALVAILSGLLTQITSSGFALSRLTTLPVALLLVLIACAAFLFVLMGATKSAYNHLLNRDDFRQQANPKSERIVGTIASVYWPLTVVIYLLWSFIFNAWSISWLVWPIAGIAFGAIAGGISTWHNSNQGEK